MRAGIALGSNIEPRLLHLQAARKRLLELHIGNDPAFGSRVYETSPVDCAPGTSNFLNAVLEISTDLDPEGLLHALRKIENAMGRPPDHEKNSPRTIDLDVLYYDELTQNTPSLTIPHPRISERKFVLQPLADIRPSFTLPGFGTTVRQLLDSCRSSENLSIFSNSIY